jgi:hypothetical protein
MLAPMSPEPIIPMFMVLPSDCISTRHCGDSTIDLPTQQVRRKKCDTNPWVSVDAKETEKGTMKGWVLVEPEGIEGDDRLAGWIQRAVKFVGELPAK